MRKLLSIVLALTLVLGMLPVFADQVFDVENTGAKNLKHYGFIGGDENGNLKENEVLTREQLAIVLATLHGKFEQAKAFEAATGYADESEFPAWAKNFISYAKAQGWLVGNDKNMFDNKGVVSAEMLASVFLRILGHVTAEKPVEWGKNVETLKEKTEIEVRGNALTRGEAFEAMWIAVSTPVMSEKGKVLGVELGKLVMDKFEVTEIKAASAKEVKITFSKKLSEGEAEKVEASIMRGKTNVSVTSKWNDERNELVLTSKTNFPHAELEVVVNYDKAEISKEKITFSQQKIGKIEFVSDAIAVDPKSGKGYVVYRVYDQYGVDITDSYLSSTITFNVADTVNHIAKKGILTLTPKSTALLQFQVIPIIAYETNSGINVSVSLPTTTKLGAIADFQFGDPKDIKLVDGDLASVFHLPYEAIDQAGGKTQSFDLVQSGLILENDKLVSSLSNVVARVVRDPKDATKAVIEVRVTGASNFNMDMPVTITAMTYTGKTSSVNLTLSKAREVESFTLLAPSHVVSEGDMRVEIPFEAMDQDGNKITRFAELVGKVDFNPTSELTFTSNAKGEAVLRLDTATPKGPKFITATVKKTARFSQLQLQIQEKAKVERLVLAASGSTIAFEKGVDATFVLGTADFHIADQYNRPIPLTGTQGIIVAVDKNEEDVVKVKGVGSNEIYETEYVLTDNTHSSFTIRSNVGITTKEKSTQVTVYLVKNKGLTGDALFSEANVIDHKKITFVSVPTELIIAYDIDGATVAYADTKDMTQPTDREKAYAVGGSATGITVNNIRNVILLDEKLTYDVEQTSEFTIVEGNSVLAAKPLYGKSESVTKYTIALSHGKNTASKTFELKGSTAAPVAKRVIYVGSNRPNLDGVVSIAKAEFDALADKYVQSYKHTGAAVGAEAAGKIRFVGLDQYGTGALNLTFTMATLSGTGTMTITPEGKLVKNGTSAADDLYLLTATAANGMSYTVKIKITN